MYIYNIHSHICNYIYILYICIHTYIYIYIYIIYTSHQLTLLTSQRLTKAWGHESTKVMGRWVIWVVTGILRIKDITDWPSDILVLVLRRQSHCVTDCCDPATTGWWHFCKRLVQFSRIIQENCCDFRIRHDSWPIDCELGQGCSYCSVGAARGRSVKLKWDCSCKWVVLKLTFRTMLLNPELASKSFDSSKCK